MSGASDIRLLCGDDFAILSGDDPVTFPIMALGGTGAIAVASNIAPGAYSEMVDAMNAGNVSRGRELHYALTPLFRALSVETNPIPVKAAASLLGLCSDEMRLPMVPLSGEKLEALREVMETVPHLLPTPEEVL